MFDVTMLCTDRRHYRTGKVLASYAAFGTNTKLQSLCICLKDLPTVLIRYRARTVKIGGLIQRQMPSTFPLTYRSNKGQICYATKKPDWVLSYKGKGNIHQ